MWSLRRRTSPRHGKGAALANATADAAASLAQAEADHERERAAASRDSRLIESLRRIRAENHFTDVISAAFRGDMTQIQIAAGLTNDGILYALAGSLAFLTAVTVLDPKLRKSPVGKSLIMLDSGLAALYIPSVLHRFLGLQITQIGFAWYYLATVLTVGTAVWWRTAIMVATQVRARRGAARALAEGTTP